ncbi:MAG: hypothetical protein LBJ00_05350 [Planctomycetaceae bacterium]|nr:hypothetical protein [Planctomycetaceae bacterium]
MVDGFVPFVLSVLRNMLLRSPILTLYTEATLKFLKRNTQAQQREAVVQGRSLSPYRLRYKRADLNKI